MPRALTSGVYTEKMGFFRFRFYIRLRKHSYALMFG
jgi:hypothetical protein